MQEGEKVEEVKIDGLIHSPALGFLMDIFPAIRVIYGFLRMRVLERKKSYTWIDMGKVFPFQDKASYPTRKNRKDPKDKM